MTRAQWATEWRHAWEVIARVHRAGGTSLACLLCEHAEATADLASCGERGAEIAEAIYVERARRWLRLADRVLAGTEQDDWVYRYGMYSGRRLLRRADIESTRSAGEARAMVRIARSYLTAHAKEAREKAVSNRAEAAEREREALDDAAQLDAELRQATAQGVGSGLAERLAVEEAEARAEWARRRAEAAAGDVGATTTAQILAAERAA